MVCITLLSVELLSADVAVQDLTPYASDVAMQDLTPYVGPQFQRGFSA